MWIYAVWFHWTLIQLNILAVNPDTFMSFIYVFMDMVYVAFLESHRAAWRRWKWTYVMWTFLIIYVLWSLNWLSDFFQIVWKKSYFTTSNAKILINFKDNFSLIMKRFLYHYYILDVLELLNKFVHSSVS